MPEQGAWSSLFVACRDGKMEIVKYLLEKGGKKLLMWRDGVSLLPWMLFSYLTMFWSSCNSIPSALVNNSRQDVMISYKSCKHVLSWNVVIIVTVIHGHIRVILNSHFFTVIDMTIVTVTVVHHHGHSHGGASSRSQSRWCIITVKVTIGDYSLTCDQIQPTERLECSRNRLSGQVLWDREISLWARWGRASDEHWQREFLHGYLIIDFIRSVFRHFYTGILRMISTSSSFKENLGIFTYVTNTNFT